MLNLLALPPLLGGVFCYKLVVKNNYKTIKAIIVFMVNIETQTKGKILQVDCINKQNKKKIVLLDWIKKSKFGFRQKLKKQSKDKANLDR